MVFEPERNDEEIVIAVGGVKQRLARIGLDLNFMLLGQHRGDALVGGRPVVDNGWYRALTRDNVELVTDAIARFTPRGIETADGTLREVDVIVTATGFDIVKFLWPARYAGKNGRDLHDMWTAADGPRAYLGMMVPEFPNFFMIYGPNSQPLSGGTSLHSWFAVWAGYAAQCIARMVEEGKSRVEVKREAYERYNAALDAADARLVGA